MAPFST